MTNRKIEYGVIPPEADGEFVAHREEVLDLYEKPYNPAIPVVCMDEQPVQLLKETRPPIPATAQHAKRVDYEYERAGTATVFMFTEPLAGWREVAVREQKTKFDWATEMARLLEGRYAACAKCIGSAETGQTGLLVKLETVNKNCEWIYRIEANPGKPRGGIVPPIPVLAPGSALGSRPRVALSSAQATSL